ncbi:MAG: hypothetical protein ACRDL5_10320 [Solirubrobacteraceae bacterium]
MTDLLLDRFEQATWVLAEVAHRRRCWTPARHPFIERWLEGSLNEPELRAYAGEHHHAAIALAVATRSCAELAQGLLADELERQAAERDRELSMWLRFALAAGWTRRAAWSFGDDPLAATAACERVWTAAGGATLAARLMTLYALETAVGEVAARQLLALHRHYGVRDPRATEWFSCRATAGEGPAAVIEAALTGLLPVQDPFVLVRRAELSLRAYWELLDGIEELVRAGRSAV